jgi:hypothetical protein
MLDQKHHCAMEHKEFYLEKAHQFRDIAMGISATKPVTAQQLFSLAAEIEADACKGEVGPPTALAQ